MTPNRNMANEISLHFSLCAGIVRRASRAWLVNSNDFPEKIRRETRPMLIADLLDARFASSILHADVATKIFDSAVRLGLDARTHDYRLAVPHEATVKDCSAKVNGADRRDGMTCQS